MKFSSSFTIIIFFLSFVSTGFYCTGNNNQAPVNVVYYYPDKNVYYDSLKGYYYYSLDGAKTWDSMTFHSTSFGTVLGRKVAIPETDAYAWLDNELHRKEYNGTTLNIINSQTISLSKADSINRIKPVIVIKPQSKEVVEKEEPPKRGLKKFFNKLFGKKKKPAEEKEQ